MIRELVKVKEHLKYLEKYLAHCFSYYLFGGGSWFKFLASLIRKFSRFPMCSQHWKLCCRGISRCEVLQEFYWTPQRLVSGICQNFVLPALSRLTTLMLPDAGRWNHCSLLCTVAGTCPGVWFSVGDRWLAQLLSGQQALFYARTNWAAWWSPGNHRQLLNQKLQMGPAMFVVVSLPGDPHLKTTEHSMVTAMGKFTGFAFSVLLSASETVKAFPGYQCQHIDAPVLLLLTLHMKKK